MAKPPRRKKKMTSILPDSLDVIEECSEESESSSVQDFVNRSRTSPYSAKNSNNEKMPVIVDGDEEEKTNSKSRHRSIELSPVEHKQKAIITVPDNIAMSGLVTKQRDDVPADEDTAPTSSSSSHESASRKARSITITRLDESISELDGEIADSQHSEKKLDEVESGDDDDQPLLWRLDPAESLSDWTIRVTNKDDGKVQRFHVHKRVLSSGKPKSEYFAHVFSTASREPKARPLTDIGMATVALKALPYLLDYMYSHKSLKITSENAAGLRFLAQFFGMKVLFKKVMTFIEEDLSLATIVQYVQGATNLGDEKLLGITSRHCARNILKIDESHRLLQVISPAFLIRILSAPGVNSDERKYHKSRLVASFCRFHKEKLNDETFLELTSESYIPLLDSKAAMTLLELESDLIPSKSDKAASTMSNLQRRCVKELSPLWKQLCQEDPQRTSDLVSKLPSAMTTKLMEGLLETSASGDADNASTDNDDEKIRYESPPPRRMLRGNSSPAVAEAPRRGILKASSTRDGAIKGSSRPEASKEAAPDRSRVLRKSSSTRVSSSSDEDDPPDRDRLLRKSASTRLSSASEEAPPSRGLGTKSASLRVGSKAKSTEADDRPKSRSRPRALTPDPAHPTGSGHTRARQDYEARIAALKEAHEEELAKLKEEYEAKLSKLRDMCIEKDKHISRYWEEISRFQRLPNSNDGKIFSSGLLNGYPTKMPEIGKQEKDGFLLCFKKGGPKYPLFYYKCD